ncbi:hypothetical protein [Leeia sp.]|uniref:hypothetical protein n=1 Tax=Leeia sp. TaxID=2884678 RepID=UPI0035AE9BED
MMEALSCWEALGLAPCNDPRLIKRAYARLLKSTRPEDDPAAFQQLREALEQALWLAEHVDFSKEDTEPDPLAPSVLAMPEDDPPQDAPAPVAEPLVPEGIPEGEEEAVLSRLWQEAAAAGTGRVEALELSLLRYCAHYPEREHVLALADAHYGWLSGRSLMALQEGFSLRVLADHWLAQQLRTLATLLEAAHYPQMEALLLTLRSRAITGLYPQSQLEQSLLAALERASPCAPEALDCVQHAMAWAADVAPHDVQQRLHGLRQQQKSQAASSRRQAPPCGECEPSLFAQTAIGQPDAGSEEMPPPGQTQAPGGMDNAAESSFDPAEMWLLQWAEQIQALGDAEDDIRSTLTQAWAQVARLPPDLQDAMELWLLRYCSIDPSLKVLLQLADAHYGWLEGRSAVALGEKYCLGQIRPVLYSLSLEGVLQCLRQQEWPAAQQRLTHLRSQALLGQFPGKHLDEDLASALSQLSELTDEALHLCMAGMNWGEDKFIPAALQQRVASLQRRQRSEDAYARWQDHMARPGSLSIPEYHALSSLLQTGYPRWRLQWIALNLQVQEAATRYLSLIADLHPAVKARFNQRAIAFWLSPQPGLGRYPWVNVGLAWVGLMWLISLIAAFGNFPLREVISPVCAGVLPLAVVSVMLVQYLRRPSTRHAWRGVWSRTRPFIKRFEQFRQRHHRLVILALVFMAGVLWGYWGK